MTWERPKTPYEQGLRDEWREETVDSLTGNRLFFSMLIMEYFGKGIAPIYFTNDNMNKVLSVFPPAEQDKMRRKFRKVWRQVMAQKIRESRRRKRQMRKEEKYPLPHSQKRNDFRVGHLDRDPQRPQELNRKMLVKYEFERRAQELVQKITQREYNEIEMVTLVNDLIKEQER